MIVGIKIMGGLANMMFQIATGETLRAQGNLVYYTNIEENFKQLAEEHPGLRHPTLYKDLFPNFDWDAHKLPEGIVLKKKNLLFGVQDIAPVMELCNGIEYTAYFQSEKNFLSRDFVRHLFEPAPRIKEKLSLFSDWSSMCSIHVRRSDYVNLTEIHGMPGMDYYKKAMWCLEPFKVEKFVIFSDDIPWCRENFKGNQFMFVDSTEDVSLYLMGMCRHHIIANSSFSWWGAWLGETQDSVIIAPERWFACDKMQAVSGNIVPQRWVKY